MQRTLRGSLLLISTLIGCPNPSGSNDCDATIDGWIDADGDGYGTGEPEPICPGAEGYAEKGLDCEDVNPDVHPGLQEQCNGKDDDCNGTPDDGLNAVTFYSDGDGDGFGTQFPAEVSCGNPEAGWSRNADDCDDTAPDVNPDQSEICNGGIDDDCNGAADDSDLQGIDPDSLPVWYRDADSDGFGDRHFDLARCVAQAGYIADNTDCNDSRVDVNPDANEVCNNQDDNCDGFTDDEDPAIDPSTQDPFYADNDGDGFGDGAVDVLACEAVPGLSSPNPNDCDDNDAQVNPGEFEHLCDSTDNDCDASSLDNPDIDNDSFAACSGDCNDANPAISPDAVEVPSDGVDANCNNLEGCFADADGDGARTTTFTEVADRTCTDPGLATIAAPVDCDDNDSGVDVDVGWFADADGDGFGAGAPVVVQCLNPGGGLVRETEVLDCDDADPFHSPDTLEVCTDLIDQNCNAAIDCDDADCGVDPSCLAACADLVLASPVPSVTQGTTIGKGNDTAPQCVAYSMANDVAFQWTPPADGFYTIDTVGSPLDTTLYVLDGCGGATLACNDDTFGLQSQVQVQAFAGQALLIIVDGYGMNNGQFTLNIN